MKKTTTAIDPTEWQTVAENDYFVQRAYHGRATAPHSYLDVTVGVSSQHPGDYKIHFKEELAWAHSPDKRFDERQCDYISRDGTLYQHGEDLQVGARATQTRFTQGLERGLGVEEPTEQDVSKGWQTVSGWFGNHERAVGKGWVEKSLTEEDTYRLVFPMNKNPDHKITVELKPGQDAKVDATHPELLDLVETRLLAGHDALHLDFIGGLRAAEKIRAAQKGIQEPAKAEESWVQRQEGRTSGTARGVA